MPLNYIHLYCLKWLKEKFCVLYFFTYIFYIMFCFRGFPGGVDGKELACSAGDPDSIPGSERSPGDGNGYLLQYSCLENSMNRETW